MEAGLAMCRSEAAREFPYSPEELREAVAAAEASGGQGAAAVFGEHGEMRVIEELAQGGQGLNLVLLGVMLAGVEYGVLMAEARNGGEVVPNAL
jgi:hypothetical protein